MEATPYTARGLAMRWKTLLLVAVLALAVIGNVVGLRAGVPEHRAGLEGRTKRPASGAHPGALPAPSYAEVGAGALRPEATTPIAWSEWTTLLAAPAQAPVTDMEARLESLAVRASRRAFNGAPPTVPHGIDGMADTSCTLCHGQGIAIEGAVARALPHADLGQCTQCHVAAAPAPLGGGTGTLASSTWRGKPAPEQGRRAYAGAPPVVPHTLAMRENCAACHGVHGWPGMQTSHPERSSCLQCHAPVEDQAHPGRTLPASWFLPPPPVAAR
ncbi:MAG: diheme cytochrome c precursor [Planctomycetota bacterium]